MDGKAADAYALLALVAGQDVEPAEDSDGTDGRWRIARKVAPDRMISTVDPDTRHAHKTQSRQQDGFKAHIVIEPDTGLITAAELTKASGPENSDGTVGARLLTQDPTISGTSVDVLADSAYGSGEMLAAMAGTGHSPVIKPWPSNPTPGTVSNLAEVIAIVANQYTDTAYAIKSDGSVWSWGSSPLGRTAEDTVSAATPATI